MRQKSLISCWIAPLLFFAASAVAQPCVVKDSTDWECVEVRIMNKKKQRDIDLLGEGMVKVHGEIWHFDELSATEINQMKQFAAKWGACVVYVDVNHLYETALFPWSNELYFYFGNPR